MINERKEPNRAVSRGGEECDISYLHLMELCGPFHRARSLTPPSPSCQRSIQPLLFVYFFGPFWPFLGRISVVVFLTCASSRVLFVYGVFVRILCWQVLPSVFHIEQAATVYFADGRWSCIVKQFSCLHSRDQRAACRIPNANTNLAKNIDARSMALVLGGFVSSPCFCFV